MNHKLAINQGSIPNCVKSRMDFRGIMEVNTESLVPGLLCLAYLAYCVIVKGAFWKSKFNLRNRHDGEWVTPQEGPIFFILMVLLFSGVGIALILEGLNII